jgi:hypothetical protein
MENLVILGTVAKGQIVQFAWDTTPDVLIRAKVVKTRKNARIVELEDIDIKCYYGMHPNVPVTVIEKV